MKRISKLERLPGVRKSDRDTNPNAFSVGKRGGEKMEREGNSMVGMKERRKRSG